MWLHSVFIILEWKYTLRVDNRFNRGGDLMLVRTGLILGEVPIILVSKQGAQMNVLIT